MAVFEDRMEDKKKNNICIRIDDWQKKTVLGML